MKAFQPAILRPPRSRMLRRVTRRNSRTKVESPAWGGLPGHFGLEDRPEGRSAFSANGCKEVGWRLEIRALKQARLEINRCDAAVQRGHPDSVISPQYIRSGNHRQPDLLGSIYPPSQVGLVIGALKFLAYRFGMSEDCQCRPGSITRPPRQAVKKLRRLDSDCTRVTMPRLPAEYFPTLLRKETPCLLTPLTFERKPGSRTRSQVRRLRPRQYRCRQRYRTSRTAQNCGGRPCKTRARKLTGKRDGRRPFPAAGFAAPPFFFADWRGGAKRRRPFRKRGGGTARQK